MPFSSMKSPDEMARAQMAIEAAWTLLKDSVGDGASLREKARLHLAYIVASLLNTEGSDSELVARAVARFKESIDPDALA